MVSPASPPSIPTKTGSPRIAAPPFWPRIDTKLSPLPSDSSTRSAAPSPACEPLTADRSILSSSTAEPFSPCPTRTTSTPPPANRSMRSTPVMRMAMAPTSRSNRVVPFACASWNVSSAPLPSKARVSNPPCPNTVSLPSPGAQPKMSRPVPSAAVSSPRPPATMSSPPRARIRSSPAPGLGSGPSTTTPGVMRPGAIVSASLLPMKVVMLSSSGWVGWVGLM